MASTPKMEYQVFLCIFQKNLELRFEGDREKKFIGKNDSLVFIMAYYNNRPGHHTWNVSSVTYWNPIDMFFSEQVYIIKWWSKNQVSENSVKYSWNYEALSVSLKCPINHEIKKIKISCFGNTKILTLTCFDPNMKKIKTREQG